MKHVDVGVCIAARACTVVTTLTSSDCAVTVDWSLANQLWQDQSRTLHDEVHQLMGLDFTEDE
jgi:hypothetical protein